VPTVSELNVVINADTRDLDAGLGKADKSVSGFGSSVSGMVGGAVKGFGALGLAAAGVGAAIDGIKGIGSALGINALSEMEQVRASFQSFTKDSAETERILGLVREEANKTPFAFGEMAKAAASLQPVAKSSGIALMDLVKEAEILGASNPLEGLEGASFSLKEAMTGDFTSIIERFNLSRSSIKQWKDEGVPNIEIVRRAMKEMGLDSDLIAAKAETLEGRWSTFQDTLVTLQMRMGQPIFDALKQGLTGLQGSLDSSMPKLEALADAVAGGFKAAIEGGKVAISGLSEILGKVFSGDLVGAADMAQDALGKIGEAIATGVEEWVPILGEWVVEAGTGLLDNLGDLLVDMMDWQQDAGADIIEKLAKWAAAFIDWVGPMIPDLLRDLGGLLVKVTTWIVNDGGPTLITNLLKWGAAFVDWVGPRIPPLLLELGKLLLELGGWILTTALPAILLKIGEWASAFVDWVAPKIPPLLVELGKLLADVGLWILDVGAPALVAKLGEWAAAFLNWVAKDVLPDLPARLGMILTGIGDWVTAHVDLVKANVKSIGAAMLDGIQDGISSSLGGFWDWLQRNFVDRIPEFVRDLLNIHSPSGVFMDIGRNMVDGLRIGMEGKLPSIDKLVSDMLGKFGGGGQIADYITKVAMQLGIDPIAALKVAQHEGGTDEPAKRGTFATGSSWWPFQLHYGGAGYEYLGTQAGMGNDFTRQTGWSPGDPAAWKDSIDFALKHAAKYGWGAWYGRVPAGVGAWEGIPGHAAGGWVGLNGPELGVLGERGPEYVIPNHQLRGGSGGMQTIRLDVAIGGKVARQVVIEGYDLAVRQGWTPGGLTG